MCVTVYKEIVKNRVNLTISDERARMMIEILTPDIYGAHLAIYTLFNQS